jgi:hypothetical protein
MTPDLSRVSEEAFSRSKSCIQPGPLLCILFWPQRQVFPKENDHYPFPVDLRAATSNSHM